jgi:hypothetical protein
VITIVELPKDVNPHSLRSVADVLLASAGADRRRPHLSEVRSGYRGDDELAKRIGAQLLLLADFLEGQESPRLSVEDIL